ncbi:hypothetical protein [Melittangium boletus]|uniref:Uncharacterized protein n=1 Tax=Melittangium boletus DSM 14713 TaxID=1294270 RepID=A0A250IQT8_9BACT|nr:hypothetical protein [Melittangium boletus]ATB33648.1 hypothetical protein MEBOL_007146 [Melittangium boletus DSM 14713]
MDRMKVVGGVLLGWVALGSAAWTSREIPPSEMAPALTGASCAGDFLIGLPAVESGRVVQAHPQGAPSEMVWIFQCWNGTWQTVATFTSK